jgi:hypothetical protein
VCLVMDHPRPLQNNILLIQGSCLHAIFLPLRPVTFPQVHSYTFIPNGESCVWFYSHSHLSDKLCKQQRNLISIQWGSFKKTQVRKLEDAKGVNRRRKSNGRRTHNTVTKRQKDKQRSCDLRQVRGFTPGTPVSTTNKLISTI